MQIRQLVEPNKTLFTLTQTFRYLNCCCNFFLYSATSSLFRRQLKEIFKCSNSLINNQKEMNFDGKNRTGTLSSPPLNPANKADQQSSFETRTLLSSTVAQTTTTIGEISNLNDSTNGHTVSFKA
jgi:hypothetical protein